MIRKSIAFIFVIYCLNVNAQQFEKGEGFTGKWGGGQWSGEHSFKDVYCLKFPDPDEALDMQQQYFSNNGVHLTRVTYQDKTMANIVVSIIPPGRSSEDEVSRLLKTEREAEKLYQHDYHINVFEAGSRRIISLKIKDVAPAGKNDPFPLVRPIYDPAKSPIESLSIHRLFVRGLDRYEIAVFKYAPENANKETERIMTSSLTTMADNMLNSLLKCSPGRKL